MSQSILNPLALANQKLAEARAAAKAHLSAIKSARSQMERDGFQFAPTATPAQVAAAGAEWEAKRTALRAAEVNFRESVFVMDLVDDLPETKAMLEAALEHLQARNRAYLKATRATLLSKLKAALKPSEPVQDEPPARELPRGPRGHQELPPIEEELASIAKQVAGFPEESKSLAGVLSLMNALNSRLELPEAKPKQAVRQDKGFVVRQLPSPPQPRTPYTHPLPIAQINHPEPSQPMRAQRIITGA